MLRNIFFLKGLCTFCRPGVQALVTPWTIWLFPSGYFSTQASLYIPPPTPCSCLEGLHAGLASKTKRSTTSWGFPTIKGPLVVPYEHTLETAEKNIRRKQLLPPLPAEPLTSSLTERPRVPCGPQRTAYLTHLLIIQKPERAY